MKDEIKEILNGLNVVIKHGGSVEINSKECKKIIDYITNLQEELEDLKELCDKYEEEHKTAFKLWTMKMEEMPTYEEKETLKLKVEKAIKYIKEADYIDLNGYDLLKILGSDEE